MLKQTLKRYGWHKINGAWFWYDKNGERDGEWVLYDENGNFTGINLYKKGKLIKIE